MSMTGAASLSRTTMRRGRHHDPPSSVSGRRGGWRSSLRCNASPVQRTLPCADSDQMSPCCHPHCCLPTRQANPRRFCCRHQIASRGRRCAQTAPIATPSWGRRRPSSTFTEVGAQRRRVSRRQRAVRGGERE